jgi:hypothetical protein
VLVALVCAWACACGDARTTLPSPPPTGAVMDIPEETVPATSAVDANGSTTPGSAPSSTDASGRTLAPWKSAGVKQPLPGGDLATSYPRVQTRPPPETPKLPPGQAYWFITVKFCADDDATIPGDLVDPARFQVEVPGQGYVAWKPEFPVVYGEGLTAGGDVAPGTCREGTVSYIIAGELHVESITFDAGSTLLRWAS